jgi:hypothetical protein
MRRNGCPRWAKSAHAELDLGRLVPLLQAIPELARVGQSVGQTEKRDESSDEDEDDEPAESPDVVHETGLEPVRVAPPEPKSGASANSATRAWGGVK